MYAQVTSLTQSMSLSNAQSSSTHNNIPTIQHKCHNACFISPFLHIKTLGCHKNKHSVSLIHENRGAYFSVSHLSHYLPLKLVYTRFYPFVRSLAEAWTGNLVTMAQLLFTFVSWCMREPNFTLFAQYFKSCPLNFKRTHYI